MYRLSASNASQWMSCHAATDLEKALPGYVPPVVDSTPASNKGTQMHTILAAAIAFGSARDLADIVSMLSYVSDLLKGRRFNVLVEFKMRMSWLHQKSQTTADVVLYLADEIHIIDHKTGMIPVDPDDPQLISYGAAAFATGLAPKAKGVWLHVNQPKAGNQVKHWVSLAEIDRFMATQRHHEKAIEAGDLQFGPSYKACLFCPANPVGRGSKGTGEWCPVAIRPPKQWSASDLTHLIQAQDDSVRSGGREVEEL